MTSFYKIVIILLCVIEINKLALTVQCNPDIKLQQLVPVLMSMYLQHRPPGVTHLSVVLIQGTFIQQRCFEKICVQTTCCQNNPHSHGSSKTNKNAVLCMNFAGLWHVEIYFHSCSSTTPLIKFSSQLLVLPGLIQRRLVVGGWTGVWTPGTWSSRLTELM